MGDRGEGLPGEFSLDRSVRKGAGVIETCEPLPEAVRRAETENYCASVFVFTLNPAPVEVV